jgi:hypothetical protein
MEKNMTKKVALKKNVKIKKLGKKGMEKAKGGSRWFDGCNCFLSSAGHNQNVHNGMGSSSASCQ